VRDGGGIVGAGFDEECRERRTIRQITRRLLARIRKPIPPKTAPNIIFIFLWLLLGTPVAKECAAVTLKNPRVVGSQKAKLGIEV